MLMCYMQMKFADHWYQTDQLHRLLLLDQLNPLVLWLLSGQLLQLPLSVR